MSLFHYLHESFIINVYDDARGRSVRRLSRTATHSQIVNILRRFIVRLFSIVIVESAPSVDSWHRVCVTLE